jgi:DNA-3-methyladenine glycosylase
LSLTAYGADDTTSEHPGLTSTPLQRVRRDELAADAVRTARYLLGALLVRDDEGERLVARIVETEAYAGPEDLASHARAGRTARTAVMFGPPGHAYVYLVYGLHHCLNVVCGSEGEAAAVLIRAVEPLAGIARMRERRGPAAGPDERLAAGPARTCQALAIGRDLDGLDLVSDERLWLACDPAGPPSASAIVSGPRVGVDYAGPEWSARPWRFGLGTSPSLSRPFEGAD